MKRPTLGQVCRVSGAAAKTREVFYNPSGQYEGSITTWVRNPIPVRSAMFVGWRIWSVGKTRMEREYGEYGHVLSSWTHYHADEHREVWWFVADARHTPFYAFPDDVQFGEGSSV